MHTLSVAAFCLVQRVCCAFKTKNLICGAGKFIGQCTDSFFLSCLVGAVNQEERGKERGSESLRWGGDIAREEDSERGRKGKRRRERERNGGARPFAADAESGKGGLGTEGSR